MNKPQAFIVKTEDVASFWPFALPLLEDAIAHSNGELTSEAMKKKCLDDDMLLVAVMEGNDLLACFTYEMRKFDSNERALFIVTISGSRMEDWLEDMDRFSQGLAKVLECDQIYAVGRRGWGKVIKGLGFNEIHTVYSKEVH